MRPAAREYDVRCWPRSDTGSTEVDELVANGPSPPGQHGSVAARHGAPAAHRRPRVRPPRVRGSGPARVCEEIEYETALETGRAARDSPHVLQLRPQAERAHQAGLHLDLSRASLGIASNHLEFHTPRICSLQPIRTTRGKVDRVVRNSSSNHHHFCARSARAQNHS